jgi:hypothetical protein
LVAGALGEIKGELLRRIEALEAKAKVVDLLRKVS